MIWKKEQTVNRLETISLMDSSSVLSEECRATAQFAREVGLTYRAHQTRV